MVILYHKGGESTCLGSVGESKTRILRLKQFLEKLQETQLNGCQKFSDKPSQIQCNLRNIRGTLKALLWLSVSVPQHRPIFSAVWLSRVFINLTFHLSHIKTELSIPLKCHTICSSTMQGMKGKCNYSRLRNTWSILAFQQIMCYSWDGNGFYPANNTIITYTLQGWNYLISSLPSMLLTI